MSDFSKKQPAPVGVEKNSRDPKPQGGEPATGFADAPQVKRDTGGPGEGIPANRRTIH